MQLALRCTWPISSDHSFSHACKPVCIYVYVWMYSVCNVHASSVYVWVGIHASIYECSNAHLYALVQVCTMTPKPLYPATYFFILLQPLYAATSFVCNYSSCKLLNQLLVTTFFVCYNILCMPLHHLYSITFFVCYYILCMLHCYYIICS